MKHTKGKCEFEQTEKVESGLDIIIKSGNNIIGWIYRSSEMDKDEYLANAELICEAFNVTNETGFTPRQLADQKAELLEQLIKSQKFIQEIAEDHGIESNDEDFFRDIVRTIQKATP